MSLLLRDLLAGYRPGEAPPRPTPDPGYRAYAGWLAGLDREGARAAWRRALAGFDAPAGLPVRPVEAGAGGYGRVTLDLTERETAALTARARELGLTLGTVAQGAFALVLADVLGSYDLAVGVTVSGRQAPVPGVDTLVGLLINTVPARLAWRPEQPLGEVLARFQESQAELLDHQHLGPAEIRRAVGRGELFDALVVVENLPDGGERGDPADGSGSRTPASGTPCTIRSR